jgi:Na+-driven multidrug efflux pump
LYSNNPLVLASASQYFWVVGPCYGFFALGLCLYFASQGAGKLIGPILAGTVRLVMVVVGGIWLTQNSGTVAQMFGLIALGMVSYGVLTAIAVWKTSWAR